MSVHGNVYSIQAPSGVEHVNVGTPIEGYGICSNTGYVVRRRFAARPGFGAQTITPAERSQHLPAHDRALRWWVQAHADVRARHQLQRELNVTMAVKNTTALVEDERDIARFFDGDIDGDPSTTSTTSRWTRCGVATSTRLALQAISLAPSHDVAIETFGQLTGGLAGGVCSIPDNPGPTASSDWAGVASYYFPSIAAGATKTVKFTYRIM